MVEWEQFSYHMIRYVERKHILIPLEACGLLNHLGLSGAAQNCNEIMLYRTAIKNVMSITAVITVHRISTVYV